MLLHIAMGLVLAVYVGLVTGEKTDFWFILFGASSALFPDLDFVWCWLISRCRIHKRIFYHRELLHKPLHPATLACLAFFYYLGGISFGLLFFLNIIMHFFIDQFSDDWGGIQWLWPFSKKEWPAKPVDVRIRLKQLEEECTVNGHTVREGIICLAAFFTVLWWVYV